MTGRIPFSSAPACGAKLIIVAQEYELVRVHSFRRKDGSTGTLLDWRSHCAECRVEFITTTTPGGGGPTRRCRTHRKGSSPVAGNRRRIDYRVIEPAVAP
jgi:hypothetical protein